MVQLVILVTCVWVCICMIMIFHGNVVSLIIILYLTNMVNICKDIHTNLYLICNDLIVSHHSTSRSTSPRAQRAGAGGERRVSVGRWGVGLDGVSANSSILN